MSTIRLTLPDGSVREVPAGTTARAVAQSIGAGLARAAVAARVDGQVRDLDRPIEAVANFSILTDKDPAALDVLRHSAAHIMATAVRELAWSEFHRDKFFATRRRRIIKAAIVLGPLFIPGAGPVWHWIIRGGLFSYPKNGGNDILLPGKTCRQKKMRCM